MNVASDSTAMLKTPQPGLLGPLTLAWTRLGLEHPGRQRAPRVSASELGGKHQLRAGQLSSDPDTWHGLGRYPPRLSPNVKSRPVSSSLTSWARTPPVKGLQELHELHEPPGMGPGDGGSLVFQAHTKGPSPSRIPLQSSLIFGLKFSSKYRPVGVCRKCFLEGSVMMCVGS